MGTAVQLTQYCIRMHLQQTMKVGFSLLELMPAVH